MKFIKTLSLLISLIGLNNITFATIQSDKVNTYEISIKELNIKNQDHDYLIFQVNSSNNQELINLKNLSFIDDKNFKTIKVDFPVKNHSLIRLIFNSQEQDQFNQLTIYTTHKGLTATTEQILISADKKEKSFFCWQKTPINKSEIIDFKNKTTNSPWSNLKIENCYNSDKIKSNQSIYNDTNIDQINNWKILPTTKSTKKIPKSKNFKSSISSKNTKTQNVATQIKTMLDHKFLDKTNPEIIISEIFPAPSSGDKKQEWIELQNITNHQINLNNWIIDDQIKGSKPYIISNIIITPDKPVIIPSIKSKISLSNTSDQVRLFRPNLSLEHQIKYQEASKDKSFNHQIIINQQGEKQINWEWSNQPSPGKINPIFHQINGYIKSNADFSQQPYSFMFQDQKEQLYLAIFDEKLIKAPLAQTLFTKSTEIILTGQIIDTPNSPHSQNSNPYSTKYILINSYQILKTFKSESNNSWPNPIYFVIFSIVGCVFLYKLNNKKKPNEPLPY